MSALGYSIAQGLVPARHLPAMLRNAIFRIPEIGSRWVALARPPSASPQAYAGRAQAKRDGLVFAIQ